MAMGLGFLLSMGLFALTGNTVWRQRAMQILKWAVAESVASGELPAAADTTGLVDLLLSMVWGMGFFAGFVGGHEELRHMTVQIRLLFEHRLTESPPGQS